MAKTNFTYEKRQKELEKKRKKEDKLKRKQERGTEGAADNADSTEADEVAEGSVEGLPQPVEGDSQTQAP